MTIDNKKAKIILDDGCEYCADVIHDNMGSKSIDISGLRKETGYITYDPGFMNTGSCMSSICYIDGEKGILRYRGMILKTWYQSVTSSKSPTLW